MIGTFIIFSCNRKHEIEQDIDFSTFQINGVDNCNILKYSSIFDNIKFVKLETNENSLIGRIDQLIFYNDIIYILDRYISKAVFIFDSSGKFLGKVGAIGKGPGEYLNPNYIDINVHSDEILVYDNFKNNIMTYDLSGKYRNTIKLKNTINAFSVLGSNEIALYFNYYGDEEIRYLPRHNLHIINTKGKILYKEFDRENSNIPNYEGLKSFSRFTNSVLFSPSFDNNIYKISNDNVSVKYKLDFGEKNLKKDFLNNIVSTTKNKMEVSEKIKNSNLINFTGLYETENYLVFRITYKKNILNIFYSKRTRNFKLSKIYINDMYGLIPGSHNFFQGNTGDMLISYIIPSDIPLDYYKYLLKKALSDGNSVKNEFLKNIENSNNSDCKNEMKNIISSIDFRISLKEFNDINSITPNDNPVLIFLEILNF